MFLLASLVAVLASPLVRPLADARAAGVLGTGPIRQAQSLPTPQAARFERLSTEDGLSHSSVTCILQDHRGFMWFGTGDGLNKYDGYTFTVYRRDPEDPGSLRDDAIASIYEDRTGVLWVGTQGGWLERYDPE
jgi:hypothetical protein